MKTQLDCDAGGGDRGIKKTAEQRRKLVSYSINLSTKSNGYYLVTYLIDYIYSSTACFLSNDLFYDAMMGKQQPCSFFFLTVATSKKDVGFSLFIVNIKVCADSNIMTDVFMGSSCVSTSHTIMALSIVTKKCLQRLVFGFECTIGVVQLQFLT